MRYRYHVDYPQSWIAEEEVVELEHGDEGVHCAEACAGSVVDKHDHIVRDHIEYSFQTQGHSHHSQKVVGDLVGALEEDGSHGRSVEEVEEVDDGGDDGTKMDDGHGDDATEQEGDAHDPESVPDADARMGHQRI